MSIPKISGHEARKLLDAAETPPPWRVDRQETAHGHVSQVVGPVEKTQMRFYFLPVVATNLTETDAALAAAAPALAETVAWLYGREADHVGNDQSTARRGPMVVEVDWARQVHLWPSNGAPFDLHITPDEAVDLARALLAAAEEADDGA